MVIEQSKEKKNNLYIELLRFVFCVLIFLHHSGHVTNPGTNLIPSGGLLADGFFMLTGYYAFRHIEKVFYNYANVDKIETIYNSGYSMKYTIKKIVRLYPYIFFGTSIIYILEIISVLKSGEATALDFAIRIRELLVEITMLPLTGILQNGDISLIVYRNTPMWYLSALLLSLPVLMYFVIQKKGLFKYYLVWFLPPILQAGMIKYFGGILPYQQFLGIVNSGVIRAFSSLLMGGMIFYLSRFLNNKYISMKLDTGKIRYHKIIATIIELSLILIFLAMVVSGVSGLFEVLGLYILAASLVITLSEITYTNLLKGERIFGFLGKLSLPIYCIHWGIYRWVACLKHFFPHLSGFILIVISFTISVGVSVLLMQLSNKLLFREHK